MSDVLARVEQNAAASRLRTIDLDLWLDAGEEATGATWTASPTTSPPLAFSNESIAVGGRSVTAVVSGGLAGTVYCVEIEVTTDGGQVEPFFFEVFITDDPC